MAQLLASDLGAVIAFTAAGAVVVAICALIVALIIDAIGDGDVVGDVQRFIELTADARACLPKGSILSDPQGETSAAIGRFLAKKEEAREALWRSRRVAHPRRRELGDRDPVPRSSEAPKATTQRLVPHRSPALTGHTAPFHGPNAGDLTTASPQRAGMRTGSAPDASGGELREVIRAIQQLALELAELRQEGRYGSQLEAKEHALEQLRWRLAALARRQATHDHGAAA